MSCRGSGVVEATNTAAVVIPEGFSVNFMLLFIFNLILIVTLVLDNMILSCLFLFNYLTTGVGSEAMVVIQGVGHARLRKSQTSGDLYIKFKIVYAIRAILFLMIRHSPEMAQEIYGDANISFTQVNTLVIPESWTISRVVAILGGKVVVSTPSGKTEIEVRFLPSEIYNIFCPGELLVLRGKDQDYTNKDILYHGDQQVLFRVNTLHM
ncbi:hypothetical protein HID58_025626 [Brassica napus]|uniref:Uncharacterized protein n=1 Tax=Brassica napus TaxID=3708 RepID=A0ABQ8CLQ0_BRANA|nr:hypothetical protein HID58_025626 [Brassica napus]